MKAYVTDYGTEQAGKSVYMKTIFIDLVTSPFYPLYLFIIGLTNSIFNSIEIIKYLAEGEISEHTDGNQLVDWSDIVTSIRNNTSKIFFSGENGFSYSAIPPINSTYCYISEKGQHQNQIQPKDIKHGKTNTYTEFPEKPKYSLVFRLLKPQIAKLEFENRFIVESEILHDFDNNYSGVTKAGLIEVPLHNSIQHGIAYTLNKLVYKQHTGNYFLPGSEFHTNPLALQILSLHNTVPKCLAITEGLLVSIFLKKKSATKIAKNPHNGNLTISMKPGKYFTEKILEQTLTKKNHLIRVFLSSHYPYPRSFKNSILYLGNFQLQRSDTVSIVKFKEINK